MAQKGRWVFIPEKEDNGGGGCVLVAILLFVALIAVLLSPLLIPIASVLMSSNEKWKFGIAGVIAFIYVQIDMSNEWISSIFFFGDDPLFSEKWLSYFTIGNYIGLGLSLLFIGMHFANKRSS